MFLTYKQSVQMCQRQAAILRVSHFIFNKNIQRLLDIVMVVFSMSLIALSIDRVEKLFCQLIQKALRFSCINAGTSRFVRCLAKRL